MFISCVPLYLCDSLSFFFRELLDPAFNPTHRTRLTSDPFTSSSPSTKGRVDLIGEWGEVEKIYLQSTFDEVWCAVVGEYKVITPKVFIIGGKSPKFIASALEGLVVPTNDHVVIYTPIVFSLFFLVSQQVFISISLHMSMHILVFICMYHTCECFHQAHVYS